jgi:acetyl esterase/lipase
MKTALDISYRKNGKAENSLTALDLYAPGGNGASLPVMVFVHGGGWAKGDKKQAGAALKAEWFTSKNCIFISLNYRLVPEVTFREQAADVAAGLAWVHSHVDKFGGDPEQIFLMGHSAGAHLAALVSVVPGYLRKAGKPLSIIKGTVLLDGAGYDIPMQVNLLGSGASRQLYTRVFGKDENAWAEASPALNIRKGTALPPFLIFHAGNRAASEFQSLALAKKLREAGTKADTVHEPRKSHATINRDIGKPGDGPTGRIMKFMGAAK